MQFGAQLVNYLITWEELLSTIKIVEAGRWHSLYYSDHFLTPAPGAGLEDKPALEGWSLITATAAITKRLRLGILVTGNTYRNPALLAKMAATVDQISNGRLNLGIGAGWFKDEHDAFDTYGKTKSLGEVRAKNFYNIRTSIVGPGGKGSLLEWFLSQKKNAKIDGYANHYWNGITTLHFAKLCYAIIKKKREVPNCLHFVPDDITSKYGLLEIFAKKFNREDVGITKFWADSCNRSLDALYPKIVKALWKDMGYKKPPTIEEMVNEL